MTYICQVKPAEKHIGRFLVSMAIFLVFGNIAFANVAFSDKVKVSQASAVKADNNGKPFVFDELSIGKVSPTVSQNESSGTGFVGMLYSDKNFQYAQASALFNCSYSLTDKRELIFQYLFPFHFFW
ncbi:MAG: hypothetical protein ACTIJ9_06595 [Aequorivita sp.]